VQQEATLSISNLKTVGDNEFQSIIIPENWIGHYSNDLSFKLHKNSHFVTDVTKTSGTSTFKNPTINTKNSAGTSIVVD
jgi:hypothetical protein